MTCRHCQAFLGELTKTPYAKEFQLICVDPSPSRPPLPTWLRVVPSLQIIGESEPRAGSNATNNWLFERRQRDSAAASSAGIRTSGGEKTLEERSVPLVMPVYSPDIARAEPSSRATTAAPAAAANGGGGAEPSPWHMQEMGASKMSDNYSFLTDAFTIEKGGSMSRILRNFEQLGGTLAGGGGAAAPATPRTKKEEALMHDFEAFSRARDADIPGPSKRI
jgi:hypothetical protein